MMTSLPNKETDQQKQKLNPKLHNFGKDQFSCTFLSKTFITNFIKAEFPP